mmetsp:Transcript_9207/g.8605  ORF Transcript_9207/g.8605 Transcript_9207/m.8605 type:complete len:167 (+) Transcript_9207:955-1455(+)
MGGLRTDHKILFMFTFSVTLLENEKRENKEKVFEKINFLFSGIQLYYGDLLGATNEGDYERYPDWDYTKHELQDIYHTIEGKILPLVNNHEVKKVENVLKNANLTVSEYGSKIDDTVQVFKDFQRVLQESPTLKQFTSKTLEQSTEKILKKAGGNVYRAFKAESLL